MRDDLGTIGFLEIACCLREGTGDQKLSREPLSELEPREVRALLEAEYGRWKEEDREPHGMARSLGLEEGGTFCLMILWLASESEDFRDALSLIAADALEAACRLYKENHGGAVRREEMRILREVRRLAQWEAGVFPGEDARELPHGWSWEDPPSERERLLWPHAGTQVGQLIAFAPGADFDAVCLHGPDGAGKTVCARWWGQLRMEEDRIGLCRSPRILLADQTGETDAGAAAVLAVCAGAGLCLNGMTAEAWSRWRPWARWMRSRGSLLWIRCSAEEASEEAWDEIGEFHHIRFRVPGMGERKRLWELAVGEYAWEEGLDCSMAANQYRLTAGQIRKIVRMAAREAAYEGRGALTERDIRNSCHRFLRKSFGNRAMKVEPRYSLKDLVLPASQKEKLIQACDQVRCRSQVLEQWGLGRKMSYGTGVSLVFSGPPGTGKTMAAQILAGELGMELYRVELAAVVSKYVGETEKNLDEIFEAAKKSQVVLFFDEADVLFGKRTEVRDSNDKYSNMEAAFLLQKMEDYDGVAILATNFLKNMDEAFKRRMKFIVEFPFPGARERLELWNKAVLPTLPLKEELDLEFLAERFELSGSNIRNIVYHACFLAAGAGGAVGMGEIIRALKNEYEKGGKTLTRQEVEPYGIFLDRERES